MLSRSSVKIFYCLTGLRLLLNVNQSDYLNYIEGAGVRVVVHHKTQHPFPDIFGYSAPTGAISSFGLKHVRLPVARRGESLSCVYSMCGTAFVFRNISYEKVILGVSVSIQNSMTKNSTVIFTRKNIQRK